MWSWRKQPNKTLPGCVITFGQYYDFKSWVGPSVGRRVRASIWGPFFSLGCSSNESQGATVRPSISIRQHNEWSEGQPACTRWTFGTGITSWPIYSLDGILLCIPHPRGQGLEGSLLLQTAALMARNNWDAFHETCRSANCIHFCLLGENAESHTTAFSSFYCIFESDYLSSHLRLMVEAIKTNCPLYTYNVCLICN